MGEVIDDVACAACGCVCDDLRITVDGPKIVQAENTCYLSDAWLASAGGSRPSAEIDGRPADWHEALRQSAALLRSARSPLIYGLSRSSTDGQRAAVRLADALRATIDTTASLCHGPSIMAIQEVGESTCSLGEVKNRADLVIFWGTDPAVSHPRHGERYSMAPAGMFVPQGRADRTVVVVDSEATTTSADADQFLRIRPGRDLEAIWSLRCLLRGWTPDPGFELGADLASLEQLAERMRTCRCGVVFFGLGLTRQGAGHRNVEALLRLVTDLNDYTRFHAKRMRIPGDVTGADSVLCWQTGYPFSVSLSRGYPRYNPGEYSANEMLQRGEADCCLLVGSEGVQQFSEGALQQLQRIPLIVLDYPGVESALYDARTLPRRTSSTDNRPLSIRFTTSVYGVHLRGTAYRMDEIPIPLKSLLPAPYPSDHQVLQGILQCLSE